MKKLLILLSVATSLLLAGCATTNNPWPGVTKTAVFLATDAVLHDNPANRPEVELVENVVCATTSDSNASPATLVANLDATGPWKPATRTFILAVTLLLEQAVNANPESPALIYLRAVCEGMTWATTLSPEAGLTRSATQKPDPKKWPQLKQARPEH